MNPKSQTINPMLQRELSAHHPSTSISAILSILEQAEQGDLVSQAELFTDMEERDAHIYAEITKRKMAVAQLDVELKAPRDAGAREKKDIAALKDRIDDNIDIETMVFNIADAIGHGFSALEIEWARDDSGFWMPKALKARPQRWFTVDIATRQQLRLRDNSLEGAELLKHGWIIHEHASKTGYIATQGLYRALALPYLFKNFATKNWLRFCELYAVPIRVLFHHETDVAKKYELLAALQAMGQSGVALLEGGTQDDLKTESLTNGEGAGFQALIEWCERSVSKAILGGTLTSSTGNNGNYATASVHDAVRYQIRDHDAKQIAETLTRHLLGAIVAVNGLTIRPIWCFDTQEPEDMALYADAIPKLVAVGAKIPVAYLHDKLKLPMPEKDEEILAVSQPPQPDTQQKEAMAALLAAPQRFTKEQQIIEDLGDSLLNALKSPISQEAIASAIRGAKDPQDLEERLATVLKTEDTSEFSRVLANCLFAADILGYAHAG
jgi:phage gp29-like protein